MLNLESFQAQLSKKKYLPSKTFLIGCSGGVDSLVLVDLLKKSNLSFALAHCNFSLRKEESNEDEAFVEKFCKTNNFVLHSKKFDALAYSKKMKLSIQMAARELRYAFFEEILNEFHYDFLVLGHHLDDSIETFFINLFRGTGIAGLCGISQKKNILRPLLSFSKEEILAYAKENQILWREDSSNVQDKYLRNQLRHQIIPSLKNINQDFYLNFKKSFDFLASEAKLIDNHLEEIKEKITLEKTENPFFWKVNLLFLRKLAPLETYLYKLFSPFGFKNTLDLKKMLHAESSKQIFSEKFRLTKHKNTWIVSAQKKENSNKIYFIENLEKSISFPIQISFLLSLKVDPAASCQINFDKIKFPLKLRNIQKNDYFYPLGMENKKKITKFLKDENINLIKREDFLVLENADKKIIWVLNKRLDERFKITKQTKQVLNIYL